MGWILGFCAMASLGLPGLAGFWGEFPSILSSYQPAARAERGRLPHLHGHRRGRHRARGRLPALALPARRVRHAQSPTVRRTTRRTTSTLPEWLAWTPLLVGIVVLGIFPNLIFGMTDDAVGSAPARRSEADRCTSWLGQHVAFNPTSTTTRSRPRSCSLPRSSCCCSSTCSSTSARSGRRRRSRASACSLRSSPCSRSRSTAADRSMFGGAFVVDNFSLVVTALFIVSGYVVVLISTNYIDEGDYYEGEYYSLLLVLDPRHGRDGVGSRPRHDLRRARARCRSPPTCSPAGASATSRATKPA